MIMTEEEMDEQIELMQEVTLEEMLYQYGDDGKWLYEQGKADAFADCVLENGEYCWQECCETEHCKECKWLGNGDTIWFE